MARTQTALITGASGEIGQSLVKRLTATGHRVVTLDLNGLPDAIRPLAEREFVGSILDPELLDRIMAGYEIDRVYHLAALLSTRSEFAPALAHKVNVEGTLHLLEFAQRQGESHGRTVLFFYPSSIAAYGFRDLASKLAAGRVREDEHHHPTTMYGANKLYCEHLGSYYTLHYKQLSAGLPTAKVDFRSLRFPGLISADTLPTGGTSDFAPELVHHAARGTPYRLFARPDTRIPFLNMPDAVDAIFKLTDADPDRLTRRVYNVRAFAPTALEIETVVRSAFPDADIAHEVDEKRQRILDSWPADTDDSAARSDWEFAPRHDFHAAFHEYLIPTVRTRQAAS